jgi:hypothetical protein
MIPDKVGIWCHSFWRNDLFQPLFWLSWVPLHLAYCGSEVKTVLWVETISAVL